MMGTYRVNYRSGMFPFHVGAVFEAADGPTVTAAVRSGVVSRIDWQPAEPAPPEQVENVDPEQAKQPEVYGEAAESGPEGEDKPEKAKKGK